jgi:hypothetical protein
VKPGNNKEPVSETGKETVCRELQQRGFRVQPLTKGQPRNHLFIEGPRGRGTTIRVKTVRGGDWQFHVTDYLQVTFDPTTGKQQVIGPLPLAEPDLINVFVWLPGNESDQQARFFVLTERDLQRTIQRGYEEFLERHGCVRPQKPSSFHRAVRTREIEPFEDQWRLLEERTGRSASSR